MSKGNYFFVYLDYLIRFVMRIMDIFAAINGFDLDAIIAAQTTEPETTTVESAGEP